MFLCPLPLHCPGPEGTAGLFNVDSRPVCPDVELLDIENPYLTPNSIHMPVVDIAALKTNNKAVNCIELFGFLLFLLLTQGSRRAPSAPSVRMNGR